MIKHQPPQRRPAQPLLRDRVRARHGAWLSVTVSLLLSAACSQAPPPTLRDTPELTGVANPGYTPLTDDGAVQSRAIGTWAAPGYGRLLEIGPRSIALFHEASNGVCLRDPLPSKLMMQLLVWGKREGDNLLVAPTLRSAPYRLKRRESLPESCNQPTETTARATFDFFSASMSDLYAFFALHDVDWQQRIREATKRIDDTTTEAELFEVLTSMLEGIDDGHVSLTAEVNGEERRFRPAKFSNLRTLLDDAFADQTNYTEAREFRQSWVKAYFSNIKTKLLSDAVSVHDDAVIFGMVRNTNVGYINILSMDGYSPTGYPIDGQLEVQKIMDQALQRLKSAQHIIVDVTFNGGGSDEISAAFASHFATTSKVAYTKQPHKVDAQFTSEVSVQPSIGRRASVPVALVTSGYTVSAAEIFTLLMRAIDTVEHYGVATAGALSDILDKPLPNGWILGLSNETYLDADGEHYEKRGIPPQHELPVFTEQDDLFESHWRAIAQLAGSLNT